VLGRYEVLTRIARGGMGVVYLCRASGKGGFRRLFALKVLQKHLSADPVAARLFLHEARIAARIYDPHVVGIVDVGVYGAQPYIVMDYIEGGTLHELLRRTPEKRSPRLILPIVLDALQGLHAAHCLLDEDGRPAGVVHSDVSPQNMLVGVDGTCRLTDFGVARLAAVAPPGAAFGKPGYLSPEQASNGFTDHRADLFSIGVVLWNALTGEKLFDGKEPSEVVERVRRGGVTPPSKVGLHPPECLDEVCLKALASDPERRYQSAREMEADLRATAVRADLLAPASEIAEWVQNAFGAELSDRRLAALGLRGPVSRPSRSSESKRDTLRLPAPSRGSKQAPDARRSEREPAPPLLPDSVRRWLKHPFVWLVIVTIVVVATWPEAIAHLLRLDRTAAQPPTEPAAPTASGGSVASPSH
jgi:serine/threonine-protein kinase